jgi:hypothetical protein
MNEPKFKLGEVVVYKNPDSSYYRQYTISSAEYESQITRPRWRYFLSDTHFYFVEEDDLIKIN